MARIGFIGLGMMGKGMAANLQKGIQKDGHTVVVQRGAGAGAHAPQPAGLGEAMSAPRRPDRVGAEIQAAMAGAAWAIQAGML